MSSFLILAALVAAACYFGWSALGALRSGEVSLYVRANRDRRFSRRANPAGYWIVVCWYLVLATVCASGVVFALLVAIISDGPTTRRDAPHVGAEITNLGHDLSAPASKLEPFLHGSIGSNATKGHAMITMGIGVAAGIFYWLAWYKLAFWILIYAIIYGGLGALRGDNQAHLLFRRDSAVTIAVLIPVAWHIGGLAGYL